MVSQGGERTLFAVTDAARYPDDAHPPGLFSREGPARLSLVTCAGSWDRGRRTYLERLIVHAALGRLRGRPASSPDRAAV